MHWQKLVDSNIRSGTLACMWCLKAQYVKKLSKAFNKWRLVAAILQSRESSAPTEKRKVVDDSPRKAASLAVQNAIAVMNRIKPVHRRDNTGSRESMKDESSVQFPWETRRTERLMQTKPTTSASRRDILEDFDNRPRQSRDSNYADPSEHGRSFTDLSSALLDTQADPEAKRQLLRK